MSGRSILIANRGEIACRLAQACQELGYEAVAVYTAPDRLARHVQMADRALATSSYLDIEEIVRTAREAGVDAIHPGYGFLAENPLLPEACQAAGLTFIGPPASVIRLMGDKLAAKELAARVGLPLVPGNEGDDPAAVGFPLLIKAAAGGGGKGMRVVRRPADFAAALAAARREAEAAFGDGRLFLERLIEQGRHVEVQVIADQQGNTAHLGERDCSIQRRYQKVIEESPAPGLSNALRRRMQAYGVTLAQAAGYVGPGTVEFLVEGGNCYFLEMNTRLQVEHPVTELVTGLDLAKLQIEIAFGAALPPEALQATARGHAMEARVYAEDPAAGFLPATGVVRHLELPNGPGIRNDRGIQPGDEVRLEYDPLLAKLIVWGANRAEALARLQYALRQYCILGVTTNLPFLVAVASHPEFEAGRVNTRFIQQHFPAEKLAQAAADPDLAAAAAAWQALRQSPDPFRQGWRPPAGAEMAPDGTLLLEGRRYRVHEDEERIEVWRAGRLGVFRKPRPPSIDQAGRGPAAAKGEETVTSPLTGMVSRVLVHEGAEVEEHQPLVILEAMKMEHSVEAPFGGVVRRLHARAGEVAHAGEALLEIAAG